MQVLLYGLEKSGKSTLISSFQQGLFTQGTPATAQHTSEITLDTTTFNIIEVGGRKEVRGFVSKFIEYVEAIIFVIDGSDEGRFSEVIPEFEKILNHPHSIGKPLAILFHKKDIAQVHPSGIIEQLDILNRLDRPHRVFSSTAQRPQDFELVLTWIKNRLTEEDQTLPDRLSRFLTIYILDMINGHETGLPILSILGQLEIISKTGQVEYDRDKIMRILRQLLASGEIEFVKHDQVYRLTQKGQAKLQSSVLVKGSFEEELRTVLDEIKANSSVSKKSNLDKEIKDLIDDVDLDDLAELYKKTTNRKKKS
ncbi:MAG: ADP-ribosylation factor-like protein [Promethearchaeota archaeon]